jgi:hypothetical protein
MLLTDGISLARPKNNENCGGRKQWYEKKFPGAASAATSGKSANVLSI